VLHEAVISANAARETTDQPAEAPNGGATPLKHTGG